MKKIGLGVLVMLFASASILANGNVGDKKVKKSRIHNNSKSHCTKKTCPNMAECGNK